MSPLALATAVSLAEADAVSSALGAAFISDPVFVWMLPDLTRRPIALRRYFDVEAGHIALQHECSVGVRRDGELVGAALVFPPDRWRMPTRVLAARAKDYLQIFGRRTPHALGMLSAVERRHLRRSHYYLGYIGVVPDAQGRGYGGALLEPITARCDAETLPAYLEASSPGSAALYRRHGFVTVEQIRPFGAPPIELMVREPR